MFTLSGSPGTLIPTQKKCHNVKLKISEQRKGLVFVSYKVPKPSNEVKRGGIVLQKKCNSAGMKSNMVPKLPKMSS